VLENPSYLNILHLPNEYKIECWNRIETWVNDKCQYQSELFHSQLETLKNICFAVTEHPEEIDTFFEFNEMLDKIQRTSLADTIPELYKILHK